MKKVDWTAVGLFWMLVVILSMVISLLCMPDFPNRFLLIIINAISFGAYCGFISIHYERKRRAAK